MAAAEVVLPMPISPVTTRSAVSLTASQPVVRAAMKSASLIAGPWVKSAVGRSRSRAWTSSVAPNARASWLIAAPPCWKLRTICAVTSAGKADTPCAVTPWLPAKTMTCGRSSRGRGSPRQPAYHCANASSRPSAPGGLVNWPLRAAAASRAVASGPGASARVRRKPSSVVKGAVAMIRPRCKCRATCLTVGRTSERPERA